VPWLDFWEHMYASCEESAGPRCWPLLDDPASVLSSPGMLPDHVCREMLFESVDRWADRRLQLSERGLPSDWPLPVGRREALQPRDHGYAALRLEDLLAD
jgi:hypothetical protein